VSGVTEAVTDSQLTDILRETLDLFEAGGAPMTTTEVAEQLDLGRRSTYERLERLVDHDRLETKKVGETDACGGSHPRMDKRSRRGVKEMR